MLEALIFDVDGTVAETEDVHRRAFNLAFERHGLEFSWEPDEYRRLLAVPGGRERIAFAMARTGWPVDPAEVVAVHASKTGFYAMILASEGVPWRPGVKRLMEEAWSTGRAVALATTTSAENLEPLFAPVMGVGWRGHFAAIVTGAMVVRKKPAPDAHLEALRRMGVTAGCAVAFEDSALGVAAAVAAGIAVVATPSEWLSGDDLSHADLLLAGGIGDLTIQALASWHRERAGSCSLHA